MKNIVLPKDQRWCVGYEGRYAASYAGEIWSYCRKHPKLIKGGVLRDKSSGWLTYRVFTVVENGKPKSKLFHRMIAEAWLPNPENKPQVNHIDHDKLNNNVANLEWVTAKENVAAMYKFEADVVNIKTKMNNTRLQSRGLRPKGFEPQIVEALHTGKTSLKSMRNAVSRYRKLGNLECVIMYMTAIETYLHETRQSGVD